MIIAKFVTFHEDGTVGEILEIIDFTADTRMTRRIARVIDVNLQMLMADECDVYAILYKDGKAFSIWRSVREDLRPVTITRLYRAGCLCREWAEVKK